jgi:hypothetical protein
MKTRRTADRSVARIADDDGRAIGTSTVSPCTTNGERTKHRMNPEPGPSLRAGALSHDLIAERARAIWLERGCLPDHDQENWRDAEAQLRTELGIG